jgi:hypothetical protein
VSAISLGKPLSAAAFRTYRQRAIFEAEKWDIQLYDHCALSASPVLIEKEAWDAVANAACRLAKELLAAEAHLLEAVRRNSLPGLDRASRRHLAIAGRAARELDGARLIRFDFHLTAEGWVISEANSDVPGGINEASALPGIWPEAPDGYHSPGDPAGDYAAAIAAAVDRGPVALVHATAFSDDWQLMHYLGRVLAARDIETIPAAPNTIDWKRGGARLGSRALGGIVRFFPGDWLIQAGFGRKWFVGSETPVLNPTTSLLSQNKRFPLFCRALGITMPTWEAYLPAVEPVRVSRLQAADWVVKPAYGRVGEGIAIAGITPRRKLARARWQAALHRRHFVTQRRFQPLAVEGAEGPAFPCIGVYTLGNRVIGAYGRIGRTPLIDLDALDAPIFIAGKKGEADARDRLLR